MDSAENYFLKFGFHKATMADICSAAQMSPGSVYRYFKSKEEIIEALYVQKWDDSIEALKTSLAEIDTSPNFVDEIVRNFLPGLSSARPFDSLFMVMRSETMHNPKLADIEKNGFRGLERELALAFSSAQERKLMSSSIDAESRAKYFMIILQGLVMSLCLYPDMGMMEYAPLLYKVFE